MTFADKDIHQLYLADMRAGRNRKRYHWHEGRKRAYYIWQCNDEGDAVSIVRFTTKDIKPDKVEMLGPADLLESDEFQDIKDGKKLNYAFLTKTENRILTMRALGKSRAKIARALSGGIRRRSYTANSIKFILQKSRQRIREDQGRIKMAKISANLEQSLKNDMKKIAKQKGKTLNRVIFEACVEYLDMHQVPDAYEVEHFNIDFTIFNRLRKRLMDLENDGVVGISGSSKNGDMALHYEDGHVLRQTV